MLFKTHDTVLRLFIWISNVNFWCSFDLSSWHRRINGKAGRVGLSFYILVSILLAEVDSVTLQMRLVSENLLNKVQKQKYKKLHGKLFELWDKYDNTKIPTSQLSRATSKISGLGPSASSIDSYD